MNVALPPGRVWQPPPFASHALDAVGLHRVLSVTDAVLDVADSAGLLPALLPALADAIGCDALSWGFWRSGNTEHYDYPQPLLTGELADTFLAHAASDPLVRMTRGESLCAARLSDFCDQATARTLPTFVEVYRPLGLPYLLAGGIPLPGDVRVCVAFGRERADFDDADVAVLRALLPRLRPLAARMPAGRTSTGQMSAGDDRRDAEQLLTSRQSEVLTLVMLGLSDGQIARRLCISPRTVNKHIEHIYIRLGTHDRVSASMRWLTGHRFVMR